MPVSRRRKKRNRPSSANHPRPHTELDFDPDKAIPIMRAAALAEAAGQPAEALRIHESFPPFIDSPHSHLLRQLVELGEEAPAWLWSRWMTVQAHRGDMTGSDDVPDPTVERAIHAAYQHGVDVQRRSDLPPEAFGASLFQFDWIVRQLQIYETGELRKLVAHRAAPALLDRSDHIPDWVEAPMRGLQLVEVRSDNKPLRFTDFASGESVELLDLGLACEYELGTSFVGRVVPTASDPGQMWEWKPLSVDEPTAREVAGLAGEPDVWVDVLARAHHERRLPGMYSWCDMMTPLSDIADRAFIGLLEPHQTGRFSTRPDGMVDLTDVAIAACKNALREVNDRREAASEIWPMVAAALLWPGVVAEARTRLVRPQLTGAWTAIAASLPQPARSRAELLAA